MTAAKFILKAANALVSLVVALALLTAGAYSCYALWDNNHIYAVAGNVQEDMLRLKPTVLSGSDGDQGASFSELLSINPDVCAWVSMDGTGIDYPVLQGESNLTYINTDVYGNFALAGSIFLDSRCDKTYQSAYSLLYGHHMDNSKMFGDLEHYKEEKFFQKNQTGTLILPDRTYHLKVIACLLLPASDDSVFSPMQWQDNIDGLLDYAEVHAMYLHEDTLSLARQQENAQILALTTCSSEFTDARTIILTMMDPYTSAE